MTRFHETSSITGFDLSALVHGQQLAALAYLILCSGITWLCSKSTSFLQDLQQQIIAVARVMVFVVATQNQSRIDNQEQLRL